jgi:hypothetical protein
MTDAEVVAALDALDDERACALHRAIARLRRAGLTPAEVDTFVEQALSAARRAGPHVAVDA